MFERSINVAAWIVVAFLVIPLIVIVGSSFTTTEYVAFPPHGFTLKWYEKLAGQSDFIRSFGDSMIIGIAATIGAMAIGTLLPILIDEGVHKRGLPIERIAAVTSANVADLYALPGKGRIAVGMDADFVVVDPDREVLVDPATQESFSDYSPYEGMRFKGAPVRTILRGRTLASDGIIDPALRTSAGGRYLHRL